MDDIGIFVYIGFMILYGIMRAVKKKNNPKPPVTGRPDAGTNQPDGGLDLEEILGELLGQKKEKPVEADVVAETKPATAKPKSPGARRNKVKRLFELEPEVEDIKEKLENVEPKVTSRYQALNELGGKKAKKLDEMVSLDERTRSNLKVVNLDEDEETGSHGNLLQALHDKDEFKKAFILSEIIQRKYE